MNARQLIEALKPLEGYHIAVLTDSLHLQSCIEVHPLPLAERRPGQGDVILCNGLLDEDGLRAGGTLQAADIKTVTWFQAPGHDRAAAVLRGKEANTYATIVQLRRLNDSKPSD